ncbi:periplasmic binding protein [Candidatus Vecturithrix granuli]|uniref:Periplasmic binding protein n=1 Tax=Vecturithrix granuli TaxID=1499967 RepID=A0A081C523_VECG1|nr:periplasmic binding protein [Candidatus Vecturithrix granuli]
MKPKIMDKQHCCRTIFYCLLLLWCATSTAFTEDKNAEQASIRYAQGFTIDYHDGYKLVTILSPWKDAKTTYQYLLVQRGAAVPAGYESLPRIEIPAQSVITMSTTHLAYLSQLDLLDTLVGYNSFAHVNAPEVLKRIAEGKIREVGGGSNVNIERIMELAPELIMTYSLGSPDDEYFKLREAHLNVVLNAEYLESTPLGRAEWIKFVAAFFNKEQQAQQIFEAIAADYAALVAKTKTLAFRPTVFLNTPYQGAWWMPGGKSYMAMLLQDAGASYLWTDIDSQGSLMLDMEAVYARAAEAEFWLHPGQWERLDDGRAQDERLTQFRAFQEGNVYNNNARVNAQGGNDYWESGLTRPDIILADLIKIFHPHLLPEHELAYYKKLE